MSMGRTELGYQRAVLMSSSRILAYKTQKQVRINHRQDAPKRGLPSATMRIKLKPVLFYNGM